MRDLLDRTRERGLVRLRRLRLTAHLAHVLHRRRMDLLASRGRLEVVERLDVPAHAATLPECGQVVRGDDDDESVAAVEQHVAEDHPDLVGKLSRDDVLAMSEEVDD